MKAKLTKNNDVKTVRFEDLKPGEYARIVSSQGLYIDVSSNYGTIILCVSDKSCYVVKPAPFCKWQPGVLFANDCYNLVKINSIDDVESKPELFPAKLEITIENKTNLKYLWALFNRSEREIKKNHKDGCMAIIPTNDLWEIVDNFLNEVEEIDPSNPPF